MNTVTIKSAEQKCIELGQKKRSRKFTFELFEQRMASLKDEWLTELWPYKEAEYIADAMSAKYKKSIIYTQKRVYEEEKHYTAVEFYYTRTKVKSGSDKKPRWAVVPVLRIGDWFRGNTVFYFPTFDKFSDGSCHMFSGKLHFYGDWNMSKNYRWFDVDNPYDKFCLTQMMKEIKKLNPNTVWTDKNIFIQ